MMGFMVPHCEQTPQAARTAPWLNRLPWSTPLGLLLTAGLCLTSALVCQAGVPQFAPSQEAQYKNHRDPKGPWSVHVVRVPRGRNDFQLSAVHANGRAVGLEPVSQQVGWLKSLGTALAAINGDFYRRESAFAGDPRGLQVVEGEVLSAPAGSASFWIDAIGDPHLTNTASLFEVTWPGGGRSRFGLNGVRRPSGVELYTPTLGPSTHTAGGRELILEAQTNGTWLPLRCGKTYPARVRAVRETGNSKIAPDTMVLSIGPALARTLPPIAPGAELTLSTETRPSLRGVRTALSGGPVLVHEGKRQRHKPTSESYEFSSMTERHPRSAIGWSSEAYYLVEVDGRQQSSDGMTLNELSAFFIELGCEEAINLDGGGSATLWFGGRVRNRPCDGEERPVANALVVLKRTAAIAKQATPATAGQDPP